MDRLRRTRGVVRSAVTRTISQQDELIQYPNTTELDLRLPLDYLIQKQTSLADLDREILTSTTDDDLENEIEGAQGLPYGDQPRHHAPSDLNLDSSYFSDKLELEELSNKINDDDFWSEECPNENILGEVKCTFGGGNAKTATDDARFVPFSLKSDEDRD
ncbi:hypothetical protein HPB47_021126 [Ixodes persulcatus]|uniref:Uncharacterized protein n=1 Tax=Ixodes persulcatus TaxID=34615 RepID=A0AC60QDQ8_IXOPE|nr:hypothetical protein HPB47_021126 [Ixodes persulcatus]